MNPSGTEWTMEAPLHRIDIPDEDIIIRCIHCGMCLAVCPTYNLTLFERSSPRGRIRLIKAVAEGELAMSPLFIDEMDLCLDCQACQTVCPAGVRYGQLVEASRAQIAASGKDKGHWIKRFFFRVIFPSHARLKFLARLLRFYQRRIRSWIYRFGIIRLLPGKLRKVEPLTPVVSQRFSDEGLPEILHPEGEARYRVGFLTGCLMNVMFADVNRDTIAVLLANDCEIVTPPDQVCCGSLAAHNGDFEIARKLAKKNIDVFLRYDLDAIVINSAGCSAFMKEYKELLADDPEYREKAAKLSALSKDVNEFLAAIELKPPRHAIRKRVTYHDACHLVHTQGIFAEPRKLIRAVPGIDYVELNESTWCCGSGGIYNVVRHDESMQILERKIRNILDTGAGIVVTGNPGCMGQIEYGLRQRGLEIKVLHPVTLLRMAYEGNGKADAEGRET